MKTHIPINYHPKWNGIGEPRTGNVLANGSRSLSSENGAKTVDSQLDGPVAPNPPPLRFVHEGSAALVVVDDVEGIVVVLDMFVSLSSDVREGSADAK